MPRVEQFVRLRTMAQRPLLAATGCVLVAGLLVLLVNRRHVRHEPQPSSEISTASGQRSATAEDTSGFIGVVVAAGSVDMVANAAGRLESVDVRVGDRVRKGAVLARLDVRSVQHDLAINQASLQAARADEEVARLTLAAAQESLQRGGDPHLVTLGALSAEDQAKLIYAEKMAAARLSAAQAQVQNQQARVEQLQLHIAEATIRAPFDGMVSMRYLDPGTTVAVGSPIVHLLSEGPQAVRFAIPEEAVGRVKVGAPVSLHTQGQTQERQGRVENVAPEVDTASRMVLAIASVNPEDAASLPFGSVVRVSVEDEAQAAQRAGQ